MTEVHQPFYKALLPTFKSSISCSRGKTHVIYLLHEQVHDLQRQYPCDHLLHAKYMTYRGKTHVSISSMSKYTTYRGKTPMQVPSSLSMSKYMTYRGNTHASISSMSKYMTYRGNTHVIHLLYEQVHGLQRQDPPPP